MCCRQRSGQTKYLWSPGDKNQRESKNNIFQANRWPQNCPSKKQPGKGHAWWSGNARPRPHSAPQWVWQWLITIPFSYFYSGTQWKCEGNAGQSEERGRWGSGRMAPPLGLAQACRALGVVPQTLPRHNFSLENSSFLKRHFLKCLLKECHTERVLIAKSSTWIEFLFPHTFSSETGNHTACFYFFTRGKPVLFLSASAQPGLLCLGFQHCWGFAVYKNFSPWNKS